MSLQKVQIDGLRYGEFDSPDGRLATAGSAQSIINRFIAPNGALVKRAGAQERWSESGGKGYVSDDAIVGLGFADLYAGADMGMALTQDYSGGAYTSKLYKLGMSDGTATQVRSDAYNLLSRPTRVHYLNKCAAWRCNSSVGSNYSFMLWCGATKSASTVLTMTLAVGSATLTATGTSFLTTVEPGMFFVASTTGAMNQAQDAIRVKSVDSNTQITLEEPYLAGTAGHAGIGTFLPVLTSTLIRLSGTSSGSFAVADEGLAVVGRRLLIADNDRVFFSEVDKPWCFADGNYHLISGGGRILGIADLEGDAMVFTTNGVWRISGMILSITDSSGNPNHRVEQVSGSTILWGDEAGIVQWNGGLIVPTANGAVHLMADGTETPLSHQISDRWKADTTAGYRPGVAAIHDGHYVMPVCGQDGDSVTTVERVRACNLENPVPDIAGPGRRATFPWTSIEVHEADGGSFDPCVFAAHRRNDPGSGFEARLLGAGPKSTASPAKVRDCTGLFRAAEQYGNKVYDEDSGTPVRAYVTTHPINLGEQPLKVGRVKLLYYLDDASPETDPPTYQLYAELDAIASELSTALSPDAAYPDDGGRTSQAWRLGERGYEISFHIASENAVSGRDQIDGIQIFVRRTGRQ